MIMISAFVYDVAVQVAGGLIVLLVAKCAGYAMKKYKDKHEKTADDGS